MQAFASSKFANPPPRGGALHLASTVDHKNDRSESSPCSASVEMEPVRGHRVIVEGSCSASSAPRQHVPSATPRAPLATSVRRAAAARARASRSGSACHEPWCATASRHVAMCTPNASTPHAKTRGRCRRTPRPSRAPKGAETTSCSGTSTPEHTGEDAVAATAPPLLSRASQHDQRIEVCEC